MAADFGHARQPRPAIRRRRLLLSSFIFCFVTPLPAAAPFLLTLCRHANSAIFTPHVATWRCRQCYAFERNVIQPTLTEDAASRCRHAV